ncbi:MAG TPA: AI-2E family transporter YdiK [Trinickia sp.]|jgi:predicted PurR-regulated permease PerM|uniref:AI-2E family transporter YdiK n=1 Tax=Trinickia sp. TaxID=2571163 RepID=UPI002CE0DE7C|nr:AI-2E family transporter YdiK [Trinickia sp.]HTI19246.1 AI-2E family transporter YdiK [Trinickia sp.]
MEPAGSRGDTSAQQDEPPRAAADLTRIVLAIGTLLLLIGGSLYVLKPFVPALIWSAMIVVATWPAFIGMQKRLRGRRAAAVFVMLLVQTIVVVIPIYAAVSTITHHAIDITHFVSGLPNYALPSPPHWLTSIPIIGTRIAEQWQSLSDAGPGGVLAKIQPYATTAAQWTLGRVSQLGLFLLYILLTLILCGLLYAKGEAAALLVTRLAARVAGSNGPEIIHLIGQSIRAIALGVVVTAIIQASLAELGVWVAGVPFPGVIGAIMLIFCLVQIGPLLPLLGSIAWLFVNDSTLAGTLLIIWTVPVIMLDNVLRPILIRRAIKLPMVIILAGVFGGLVAMGVVGLFIGPVVLAVTYHLLLAWIETPDAPQDIPARRPASDPTRAIETPTHEHD